MNSRIEEIAEVCTEYCAGDDTNETKFHYNKFAELIIKECITKCKTDWYGDSLDYICVQILEHFGIKE